MIIGTKIWRCRGCHRSWLETEEAFAEEIAGMKENIEIERNVDMSDENIRNVELLILNATVNPKSNEGIFALLLAKYDEMLRDGMEIREKLVTKNKLEEAAYLTYCKNIVEARDRILILVKSWIIIAARKRRVD